MIIKDKDKKNEEVVCSVKNFSFFVWAFVVLFVLGILCLFLVNDICNNKIKLNISQVFNGILNNSVKENKEVTENVDNNILPINTYSKLGPRSFGDNFSSSAYLDMSKTNMVLDEYTTALVFPPIYKIDKNRNCENENCNFNDNALINFKNNLSCLNDQCLKVSANKILVNDKNVSLPSELNGKKIFNINASVLSSSWLVSFIFNLGEQEEVYVYLFDGQNFKPLINNKTKDKIVTRYGKGQGAVTAGGIDSDFIMIYTGYEDIAYHVKDNKLFNISRFFGLRISTANFKPIIIRQGEGDKTVWYLPGYSKYGVKLIKLWQNDTSNILGSYVFSGIFPENNNIMAVKNSNDRGQLDLIFKDSSGNSSLWHFQDKGFDNTTNRIVSSININSDKKPVEGGMINDIGLALDNKLDEIYETHFLNEKVTLFLANFDDNFNEVMPHSRFNFSEFYPALFWRAEFKKGDNNEYSPWFDHLNYLDYFVVEE